MGNRGTCAHGRPVAPEMSYYMQDRTIVMAGNIVRNPDGSGPRLITDAKFGCVRWRAR